MRVERAILLVAGGGRRLGELAGARPKCLVEVAGAPILERALEALACSGVTEAILVTGYESDQVRAFAGDRLHGVDLRYVQNPDYATTNTAYSLWLAREHLTTDCLLLEGDILFEPAAIGRLREATGDGSSAWATTPVEEGKDEGILLSADDRGQIRSVKLFPEPGTRPARYGYKCAGIQLLSKTLARAFAAQLDGTLDDGGFSMFADLVLARLIDTHRVRLCSLDGLQWAEVDTPDDLRRADRLFGATAATGAAGSAASLNRGA